MLYMSGNDGTAIIVLETGNIEHLKNGKTIGTPDGRILIAWTPDPEWLAKQVLESSGYGPTIGKAIEESVKRPQQPLRSEHPNKVYTLEDKDGWKEKTEDKESHAKAEESGG